MSYLHLQQQQQQQQQHQSQQQHQQQQQSVEVLGQPLQLPKVTQLQLQQQQIPSYASPQIAQRALNSNVLLPQPQSQQIGMPHQQTSQTLVAVKDVWAENMHQELQIIRALITQYNYVSFSTEFPGILARPIGVFSSTDDYHYQTLRANTDLLNLIQLGISLSDANGKKPDDVHSTWQFNFKFDLSSQMISDEAYESLAKTGIDFQNHLTYGIDQFEFAELLTTSGLVLLPDVHWTSFHAGYDSGFLLALLTNNAMPSKEESFIHKISLFFPHLYDLKVLSRYCGGNNKDASVKQTLESLAEELGVPRLATYVSTGGQALLTTFCLAELKGRIPDIEKHSGEVHGLKNEHLQGNQLNSLGNDV